MPKILPSQKSLALSVMTPILFEAEHYFNDLSLTKKSKKIPERLIFSKMNKYFALDFVFNSITMCVWHPYWHGGAKQIRSRALRRPLKSNVLIFFNCVLGYSRSIMAQWKHKILMVQFNSALKSA